MLNPTILSNRILEILEEDKSLAQDVIDTCEVIDAARKDLFKKNGMKYVESYENVWFVFLERIGVEVTKNNIEGVLVKPEYMDDHIRKLDRKRSGLYHNVSEIGFINAYANVTIDANFYEGKLTMSLGGELVPVSMITEAIYRARASLKKQVLNHLFVDDDIQTMLKALKILLNVHYVAALSENQRTEVGTVQAERFQNVVKYCESRGLNVITGHVDVVFVQGGQDLVEDAVECLREEYGYALHTERHGRCLFENTKRYILNINGQIVGHKYEEYK